MLQKKNTVVLSKETSERLSFLRRIKKIHNINDQLEIVIESLCKEMEERLHLSSDAWKTAKKCPKCNTGFVYQKQNKKSERFFLGCSNYPQCKHTESCNNKK